jgi:hypothetical protein
MEIPQVPLPIWQLVEVYLFIPSVDSGKVYALMSLDKLAKANGRGFSSIMTKAKVHHKYRS